MSNSPLNTRLLRSNCRSHGSGCSCPTQELPTTPRRSRSVSRATSRASSIAPELCLSSEAAVSSTALSNGISRQLDFQSVNGNASSVTTQSRRHSAYYSNNSSRDQRASSHFEESVSQKLGGGSLRDQDTHSQTSQSLPYEDDTFSRHSRSWRYEDDATSIHSRVSQDNDDKMSQLRLRLQGFAATVTASPSPSRSERERSYCDSNRRMVTMFKVDEGNETLVHADLHHSLSTTGDRNGSMALSHSSSVGSNSTYETSSRILTTSSSKVTKTITSSSASLSSSSVKNGNHRAVGAVGHTMDNNVKGLYSMSASIASSRTDASSVSASENYSQNSYLTATFDTCVSNFTSRSNFVSHLVGALLFVPRLTYWSLVNLFVCEKWLLHRSGSFSIASLARHILPLMLLLLLGMCLFRSREYLPQYMDRTAKLPNYSEVPLQVLDGNVPSQIPPVGIVPPQVSEGNGPPQVPVGILSPQVAIENAPPQNPVEKAPSHKTSCPVQIQNIQYDKLIQKLAMLERAAEEYRRSAEESYNQKLNLLNKDWELKLQKEISNIKPSTTTVVEKLVPDVELMSKISVLERTAEENHRRNAENYSQQLKMLAKDLELKIHEEISKIEPTTTIVQQTETVISPSAQSESVNYDQLSSILMPLILPLIMERVNTRVELSERAWSDASFPKSSETKGVSSAAITQGIDLTEIQKLIRAALDKYDADKTGLPDLALESAGGTILSTRCTKSSQSKNSVLTLWGWRVWSFSNSPRSIIQPGVVPGECWVVEGATAEVVIQLISPAVITGFTLEHIPKSISPYGKIDTAPRKFQVMGLMSENDFETVWDYGTYQYLDNDQPIQYFAVQNKSEIAYPIVELRVLSNHGSVRSTCIYRFRVHGIMVDIRT